MVGLRISMIVERSVPYWDKLCRIYDDGTPFYEQNEVKKYIFV